MYAAGVAKGCLAQDLTEDNCFLLFKVQRAGMGTPSLASLRELESRQTFPRLVQFVKDCHARKQIPLPGEVDMIMGGPPCQGISGLNRCREQEPDEILADARCGTAFTPLAKLHWAYLHHCHNAAMQMLACDTLVVPRQRLPAHSEASTQQPVCCNN